METFEQQIQPFIKPLIDRIQVLEDENKQLKVVVDELKEKGQKVGNDNKHNRTQTEANGRVVRPLTTKLHVEPKQPVGVKKQTKVPEKQTLTNVQKTKTHLSGKKEASNPNDVKEPETDRKQPTTKIATSPKPIKGKETGTTAINIPTNKANGIISHKPLDAKDSKIPSTKVIPQKSTATTKNPTTTGNKSNPTKSQSKTQIKQIQPQKEQPTTSTQTKQQTKIQTKQQTSPINQPLPATEQQVNKDEQLLSQPVQPSKPQQNTAESTSEQKQPNLAQEQEELI